MTPLTVGLIAGLGGAAGGYVIRHLLLTRKQEDLEAKQREILLNAKDEALKIKEEAKKEEDERRNNLQKLEGRLSEKETIIERKLDKLESDQQRYAAIQAEIEKEKLEISKIKENTEKELQRIAKLDKTDAQKELMVKIEKDYAEDLIRKIKSLKLNMKQQLDNEAREIIATAVERLATPQVAESTITPVDLPNDEIKGKIIGKEGRNIQAFEKATGVDLLIDETPQTVTISSFDPVRRAVAHRAMEMLIKDGRIQPGKIEELVDKAKGIISEEIIEAGDNALSELGITGINPELVKILGSMKFRTSYGQNQLNHSIEAARIAGLLAEEVGADVNIAKKGGLFHDIGKAVSHEQPGSHVDAGSEIARKYGLSEAVIHCIDASHEDIEAKSVEAILSRTADAISSARPGARRESTDQYIKRMTELETVATSFPGVEKAYAIQAGREVRIFVKPEMIDDLMAIKLAREIADKIESGLQYPGTVKVNVIRETRAAEVAR